MTVECVTNGMWAAPGAVRAVPGDSLEVAFSTVCRRAGAVCRRAGAGPVLPVDRGYFTTGVPGRLGRHRTRWPVPCPNSPRVAAAIRRFMSGGRPAVSPVRIPGGRGRGAPHAMVIRKGKKREGKRPEGRHVAFAASMPSADPDAPCPRGRGTGIGHRMPRQARMRAPGGDESARLTCFVATPMARNARAVMRPGRRAGGDGRKIPMAPPRIMVILEACEGPGIRTPRKPPP